MKKKIAISVSSLAVAILAVAGLCLAKEVKVQIHTVKGSGITEQQVRGWIDKANQIDDPNTKFVVDSNHVYEPNSHYDPNKNDKGRINIWGLPKCEATGEPNYVSGQSGNVVEIVPGKTEPNGPNVWVKDSTLAHELNHALGLEHSNDPNNKMYPDNWPDANGHLKSCHRKGTNLTPEQRKTISDSNVGVINNKVLSGYAAEAYDSIMDMLTEYINLFWTLSWTEPRQGSQILNLTANAKRLSSESFSEIGFYIESDNNPGTGLPPEGIDYYVAFQPMGNQVLFGRYDGVLQVPLNPAGIDYELKYIDKNPVIPPIPVGVQISLPLTLLERSAGSMISYKVAAHDAVETDWLPDAGMLTYGILPCLLGDLDLNRKIDINDLAIMADEWLGSGIADIYPPPPSGDNIVNLNDFATMANNWLAECPPVCGDGYCDPREQGMGCPECPPVCGDGFCDPREQGTGCQDCQQQWCGNGICEPGEQESGCPDCPPICGDGFCATSEQGTGCQDCPPMCGDGFCDPTEQGTSCPDCPPVCGDGFCDPREEGTGCSDCQPVCGNGICEPGEEGTGCPDCLVCNHNGFCDPGETQECPDCQQWCGNGICDPGEEGWCSDCPM